MLDVSDHDLGEGRGQARVLTMQRPPVNAMDSALLTALVDALTDSADDEDVAGVVLTGTGSTFSAGADLRERTDDGGVRRMELFTTFYELLTSFPLPTVAALEGPAVGGGAEAAVACDLRVAHDGVHLRFPGASMGIPVGTARLVGQVPLGVAKDWLLSGREVGVDEAARHGLVQRVTSPGDTLATGLRWLAETAAHHRDTVRWLKQLAHDGAGVRDRMSVENLALRVAAEGGDRPYNRGRA